MRSIPGRIQLVTPHAQLRLYNCDVARGWESKSIEEQQSEAADPSAPKDAAVTPEESARRRRIETDRVVAVVVHADVVE